MLKINDTLIENRNQLEKFIKKLNIEITNIEDIDNYLEKILKINYIILDKILLLKYYKEFINIRPHTFILYVNSNNININYDINRMYKFIDYVCNHNKDRLSKTYLTLRYGYYKKDDILIKSTSLESYIKKFGVEIGTEKHKNKNKNIKNSSKRSLNYWLNLYKDENIAKEKLKEYQQSHIKKHFKNKNREYIDIYNKSNSPWNVEFYIKKGYTIKEAKNIISNLKKDACLFSVTHYLNKGYTLKEAKKLKHEFWLKHCYNNGTNISKASLKQFNDILIYLKQYDDKICVYYGDKENNRKEYFLYDKENQKYYFYDLTILYGDIKLIIEYQGNKFHPNKKKLTENEWNNWNMLFQNNINANIKYELDLRKKQIAINNSFLYLEIWDNDNFKQNNIKIRKFINKHLILKINKNVI